MLRCRRFANGTAACGRPASALALNRNTVPAPVINTVLEHISWSYANLAAAHAAVEAGTGKYGRIHYMIRARLYKGLVSGTMNMRTLYDDEKVKYKYPRSCCYCGAITQLSMDHLIPRLRGGPDDSDNLVWACKPCNSSKRANDVLAWLTSKQRVPSILMLRRYIKLVARYCVENHLMELPLAEAQERDLPFSLRLLPYKIVNLDKRVLWVEPVESLGNEVFAIDES